MTKVEKTEQQWRDQLSEQEFTVCRQKGTEPAFSGAFWDCKQPGVYLCRCCGEQLFDAATKFDSGTGWPSFYQPVDTDSIVEYKDESLFMQRTEVCCSRCDAHLGHVFEDGPAPSGLRYCINSISLTRDNDQS